MKKTQLNIRISEETMEKLKALSHASGRSQAWIVENAISQSIEFDD